MIDGFLIKKNEVKQSADDLIFFFGLSASVDLPDTALFDMYTHQKVCEACPC